MFNKREARIDTLIGQAARVHGDMEFAGGLHLDGTIEGNLRADPVEGSSLSVSETGSIDGNVASTGELSGLYFGILNIYTTLPQFVATFISLLVFSILEPGKSPELADAHPSEHHGTDGPNAISICLLIGAFSTVGAAYATKKLRDMQ